MMKWQATVPSRDEINKHGGNRGVWVVSTPVGSPLGGDVLWPHLVFATFKAEGEHIVMYPNRGASRVIPEHLLGAPLPGSPRGTWHFAPVVLSEDDYTFQPAGA